jgi:hypothetical protein
VPSNPLSGGQSSNTSLGDIERSLKVLSRPSVDSCHNAFYQSPSTGAVTDPALLSTFIPLPVMLEVLEVMWSRKVLLQLMT